jgi:hypothetical protein
MNAADYIAFDVETATADPASLCEIKYVADVDGETVFQGSGSLMKMSFWRR